MLSEHPGAKCLQKPQMDRVKTRHCYLDEDILAVVEIGSMIPQLANVLRDPSSLRLVVVKTVSLGRKLRSLWWRLYRFIFPSMIDSMFPDCTDQLFGRQHRSTQSSKSRPGVPARKSHTDHVSIVPTCL